MQLPCDDAFEGFGKIAPSNVGLGITNLPMGAEYYVASEFGIPETFHQCQLISSPATE